MNGDFNQFLEETISAKLLETNTHIPAVVEEWNSQDDTVKLKLSIKKRIGLKSEIFGGLIDEQQETQILEDVPAFRFRSGQYARTHPIEKGDRCMLLFMQRSINCWWAKGHECNPVDYFDTRKHDLSDGVAVFGLYPLMDFIPEINLDWLEDRTIDGETRIAYKVGQGVWHQDDKTHQRISRDGYEVWRNNVQFVKTIIEYTETMIKQTDQLIVAYERLRDTWTENEEESTQQYTESTQHATESTKMAQAFGALGVEAKLTYRPIYLETAQINTKSALVYTESATLYKEKAAYYKKTAEIMDKTVDVLKEVKSELEKELENFKEIKGSVDIPEPEVADDPEAVAAPPNCGC